MNHTGFYYEKTPLKNIVVHYYDGDEEKITEFEKFCENDVNGEKFFPIKNFSLIPQALQTEIVRNKLVAGFPFNADVK